MPGIKYHLVLALIVNWSAMSALSCPEHCVCNQGDVKCTLYPGSAVDPVTVVNACPPGTRKLRLNGMVFSAGSNLDFTRFSQLYDLGFKNSIVHKTATIAFPQYMSIFSYVCLNNPVCSEQQDFKSFFVAFNRYLNIVVVNCKSLLTLDDLGWKTVKSLKTINFNDCSIKQLKPGVFAGLALRNVQMANNELTNIVKETFPESLMELDLSGNKIESIEDGSFKASTSVYQRIEMRKLDLSNNKLQEVRSATFQGCVNSGLSLDLSNNTGIRLSADVFTDISGVRELGLSNCFSPGNEMSPNLLRSLNNLQKIQLDGNSLTYIPELTLGGDVYSYTLSLRHNAIKNIVSGYFETLPTIQKLFTVDLSFNHIQNITESDFLGLEKASGKIILDNNNLHTLELGTFRKVNSNVVISLKNNPFVCDSKLCPYKWWLRKHSRYYDVQCDTPRSLAGLSLLGLDDSYLECQYPTFNGNMYVFTEVGRTEVLTFNASSTPPLTEKVTAKLVMGDPNLVDIEVVAESFVNVTARNVQGKKGKKAVIVRCSATLEMEGEKFIRTVEGFVAINVGCSTLNVSLKLIIFSTIVAWFNR